MEYCGKITRNMLSKRRMLSALGATLAMIILTGTAYELPELNYAEIASADTKMMEEMTKNPYQPIAGNINGWDPAKILTQWPDSVKFPWKNMEAGAVRLKNANMYIGPAVVLPDESGMNLTGNLYSGPDIAMDHHAAGENTYGKYPFTPDPPEIVIPGTPENVVPGTPENVVPGTPETVLPDTPENVVPDIPETVLPDTPEIVPPDVPDEGTGTDVPNDGTAPDTPSDGTVNAAAGFEINEEGLLCRFIPEEAQIDDGYLVLPAEGCTGIAGGAFDNAGEGITDIEIPDNITYIEDGALSGLPELFCIWTGDGNPVYTQVDGVLFDKDMTTIVSFPSGRIGTYELPSSVTRIADYAFANTNLSKLVMIKSLPPEVGSMAFGESGGSGLVISAPPDYFEEFQEIFSGFQVTVQLK